MAGPRSQKQEREQLARALRSQGKSWVEIAKVFRQRYRINARIALRLAHGWSQRQAADAWNERWPDELKTFKNFSYWELWPSSTGHAPSLITFDKLAQLYECSVADLVGDLGNYGQAPTSSTSPAVALPETAASSEHPPKDAIVSRLEDDDLLAARDDTAGSGVGEYDRALDQMSQFLTAWVTNMERREVLLRILGWAAMAGAAPVFRELDPQEQQRIARVLTNHSRVDEAVISNIEGALWHCKRQDDCLGPQATIETVLAQRNLARALLQQCPGSLRPRLLSVLSDASRQAGWLFFDLGDFDKAGYYYEDARTLAHEAENTELGAFVLCNMSHLATWQGRARTGIDHAVAAQTWAEQTGDLRLQAYAADVGARAYAADRQHRACLTALDQAHTALAAAGQAPSRYIHFYDTGMHASSRGGCHLELDESKRALEAARQSMTTLDPLFVRNLAMTTLDIGIAYVQLHEIDEAARIIGDAGELTAVNHSVRLLERVRTTRASIQPWQSAPAVRALDDRLASYGLVFTGRT